MTAHSIAQAIFSSPRTSALSVESRSVPVVVSTKLQALVYDILPSTSAVFSYAIGSRKLSANEQFFCWSSNISKFVTNNSHYIRHLFHNWPCSFASSNKTKIVWIETDIVQELCESRGRRPGLSVKFWFPWKTKIVWIETDPFYFTLGGCVSCLRDQYQNLSEGMTASVDSCAEIKSAPSVA